MRKAIEDKTKNFPEYLFQQDNILILSTSS